MRFSLRKCILAIAAVILLQLALHIYVLPWRHQKRGPAEEPIPCNFSKGCHQTLEGVLNVHLIPHSHDDVGWLKTLDQYYTGKEDAYDHNSQCVQCILNSTVQELLKNPDRRFIFIEMAFFSRWWHEQTPAMQKQVKQLIDQRRLQFVIGGWCMSDAATPYYNDVIDQHALGFDFIERTFGSCAQSNVAWQVDQFGHSREHASLFAQMGFDAIILGRIDIQDINQRKDTKTMEMVWKASPKNLGDVANIFTHISYDGYYAPPGFVMDSWDASAKEIPKGMVDSFIDIVKQRASVFKTNHLMMPMGSDFGYKNATKWFVNLDLLISEVNKRTETEKVHLQYSTPSCYVAAVQRKDKVWPVKEEDFLPYMTDVHSYWTGYFTSRPSLKRHAKVASATLQACKQLAVFARLKDAFSRTQVLREAVADLQHHDAITGTEKQHVTDDYNKMLSAGEKACESVIGEAFRRLLKSDQKVINRIELCPLLNISACALSETSSAFSVLVYNPVPHPVDTWLRVPVEWSTLQVYRHDGERQHVEVVPVTSVTTSLPERKSEAKYEAVFPASLPALGYTAFTVKVQKDSNSKTPDFVDLSPVLKPYVFRNKYLEVTLDTSLGLISRLKNLESNVEVKLLQDFAFYRGEVNHRASGAYVFQPVDSKTSRVGGNRPVDIKVYQGERVQEIHQVFCDYVTQVIRLYDDARHLELEWTVGPLHNDGTTALESVMGKEVVSYFNTNLKTEGVFFTDSQGREMLRRRRDARETWKLSVVEPVSGNYYPVTSRIFLRDVHQNVQVTVLTDRCQGGSSIFEGSLELMVHRRLFRDDVLGVSEPLNELGADGKGLIVRGKHFLFVDTIENSARHYREMALRVNNAPTLAFTSPPLLASQAPTQQSFLTASLPLNVHLLSLDQSRDGDVTSYVIRLEHVYEKAEDVKYSEPVEVNLEELFTLFTVAKVEELSLGGSVGIEQVARLRWMSSDGLENPASLLPSSTGASSSGSPTTRPFTVSLSPMQIRTFRITVTEPKSFVLRYLPNFLRSF